MIRSASDVSLHGSRLTYPVIDYRYLPPKTPPASPLYDRKKDIPLLVRKTIKSLAEDLEACKANPHLNQYYKVWSVNDLVFRMPNYLTRAKMLEEDTYSPVIVTKPYLQVCNLALRSPNIFLPNYVRRLGAVLRALEEQEVELSNEGAIHLLMQALGVPRSFLSRDEEQFDKMTSYILQNYIFDHAEGAPKPEVIKSLPAILEPVKNSRKQNILNNCVDIFVKLTLECSRISTGSSEEGADEEGEDGVVQPDEKLPVQKKPTPQERYGLVILFLLTIEKGGFKHPELFAENCIKALKKTRINTEKAEKHLLYRALRSKAKSSPLVCEMRKALRVNFKIEESVRQISWPQFIAVRPTEAADGLRSITKELPPTDNTLLVVKALWQSPIKFSSPLSEHFRKPMIGCDLSTLNEALECMEKKQFTDEASWKDIIEAVKKHGTPAIQRKLWTLWFAADKNAMDRMVTAEIYELSYGILHNSSSRKVAVFFLSREFSEQLETLNVYADKSRLTRFYVKILRKAMNKGNSLRLLGRHQEYVSKLPFKNVHELFESFTLPLIEKATSHQKYDCLPILEVILSEIDKFNEPVLLCKLLAYLEQLNRRMDVNDFESRKVFNEISMKLIQNPNVDQIVLLDILTGGSKLIDSVNEHA